jgi:hypothetical protein
MRGGGVWPANSGSTHNNIGVGVGCPPRPSGPAEPIREVDPTPHPERQMWTGSKLAGHILTKQLPE